MEQIKSFRELAKERGEDVKPLDISFVHEYREYMKTVISESDQHRVKAYEYACTIKITD